MWDILTSSSLVHRAGWALVHFLWQGAAVALLAAVILRALRGRSAQARYAVACAALIIMAALPGATAWVIRPQGATAALSSSRAMAPGRTVANPGAPGHPWDSAPPPEGAATEDGMSPSDATAALTSGREQSDDARLQTAQPWHPPTGHPGVLAPPPPHWTARWAGAVERHLGWIVAIWTAGVLALSLWHAGGLARLRAIRRRGISPVNAMARRVLEGLRNRLGVRRAVELLESASAAVPAVIGFLRPVILLPACALTGLTPDQLEAVLAHELAHIRRHDYLANLLQTLIETLLFYHPAVWWLSRRIRAERENCCDDLAVDVCGRRLPLASALAALAELQVDDPRAARKALPGLAPAASRRVTSRRSGSRLAPSATGGALLARIRRIAGVADRDSARPARWLAGTVLLAALLAAGLALSIRPTSAQNRLAAPATQPATPALAEEDVWFRNHTNSIRGQLQDTNAQVRMHAAEALGGSDRDEAAIPDLKQVLKDSTPKVRYAAAVSLAKLGYVDDLSAVALAECFVNGQATGMRDGPSASDVNWAFSAPAICAGAKAAVPLLIKAAGEGASSQWRCDALKILGRIGDPEAVPTLRKALHESTDDLRCTAARALAAMGPAAKDAAPDLRDALGNLDFCAKLAGEALAKIGAADVLIEEVKKREANRLEPAVLGLAFAKDHLEEAAKVLIAEVDRGNWKAAESLLALGEVARPAVAEYVKLARNQSEIAWASRAVAAAKFAVQFNVVDRVLPILIEQLDSNKAWESANAATALGEMGPAGAPATKALLKVLASKADDSSRDRTGRHARFGAAKALGKIRSTDPDVIPALIAAVDDPDPVVRENAERSLGQYGPAAAQAVPVLMKWMRRPRRGDMANGIYTDAINALAAIGPAAKDAVPALIQDIQEHHSNDTTRQALVAIGAGAAPAVPFLFEEGVTNWNRHEAKKAIAAIGPAGVPFLKEKLQGVQSEQAFAAECLAEMDSPDASLLPTLLGLLEHNDRGIRVYAARAMAKMGAGAAGSIAPLRRLLADSEPWVQLEAATALRKIAQAPRPTTRASQPATGPASQPAQWHKSPAGLEGRMEAEVSKEAHAVRFKILARNPTDKDFNIGGFLYHGEMTLDGEHYVFDVQPILEPNFFNAHVPILKPGETRELWTWTYRAKGNPVGDTFGRRVDGNWLAPGLKPGRHTAAYGMGQLQTGTIEFDIPAPAQTQPAGDPNVSKWVKTADTPKDRAGMYAAVEKVLGGKTAPEKDLLQYAPPLSQKPADKSLEDWFSYVMLANIRHTPDEECFLLFRSRRLNDNDLMWIERIERDGNHITVRMKRAIWQGEYWKNSTYHSVYAVNLGKLPAGVYVADWIIEPLEFTKSDKDSWPADAKPHPMDKAITLTFAFSNGRTGRPASAPAPATQPAGVWGPGVNGVGARLRADREKWLEGEIPSLRADVRNLGPRPFLEVIEGQSNCQVEVDGQWYEGFARGGRMAPLGVGQSLEDQLVTLSPIWAEATDEELKTWGDGFRVVVRDRNRLVLTPGEHTVRLAFVMHPSRADTGVGFRVISEPVRIEIVARGDGKGANWPAKPAVAQAIVDLYIDHSVTINKVLHGNAATDAAGLLDALLKQARSVEKLAAESPLAGPAAAYAKAALSLREAFGEDLATKREKSAAASRALLHLMAVLTGEVAPDAPATRPATPSTGSGQAQPARHGAGDAADDAGRSGIETGDGTDALRD